MLYKTMVLDLIQQHPEIHDQLLINRMLLPTVEVYAQALSIRHDEWKAMLSEAKPESNDKQIASAALELALKELEHRLAIGSPPEETELLSLEAAMEFVRRHTPPA